jgi:hypothetical protein
VNTHLSKPVASEIENIPLRQCLGVLECRKDVTSVLHVCYKRGTRLLHECYEGRRDILEVDMHRASRRAWRKIYTDLAKEAPNMVPLRLAALDRGLEIKRLNSHK